MRSKGRRRQRRPTAVQKTAEWIGSVVETARTKPAIAMAAALAVLAAGIGAGVGMAHLFPHARHAPPARVQAAHEEGGQQPRPESPPPGAPKPQTDQAATAPVLPPTPSAPPAVSAQTPVTGDDANGPAEVAPVVPDRTAVAEPQVTRRTPPGAAAPGRPAWLRYAVAAPPPQGKPMIAVVIDDMGLDRKRAEKVIALPAPLTLSFMTYAQDLPHLTAEAHARGHELMVHMPMQPQAASFDAGPQALTVGASEQDLRQRIDWGLSRFDGFVGINNHMGSRFTEDAAGMAVVMQELSKRGLLFLDSVTTPHSVAAREAALNHVPFVARQVFLDNEQSETAIAQQLAKTEAAARKHGFAIAIGHPHDTTIQALGAWLATVRGRGFVIVPVTAVAMKAMEKG